MEIEPTRDDPGILPSPGEGQGSQESNLILPSYVDSVTRKYTSEWLRPNKELHKGWDSFAEYAFDVANILSKPDNPLIAPSDIDARDDDELIGKHMPADDWERSTVDLLEQDGFDHLIPQFKQDMQEYRKAVKAIVQMWRDKGLL